MNNAKDSLRSFWNDEEGMGTLEVILIIAVVVMIALVFRKYIVSWVEDLLGNADKDVKDINAGNGIPSPGSASR